MPSMISDPFREIPIRADQAVARHERGKRGFVVLIAVPGGRCGNTM